MKRYLLGCSALIMIFTAQAIFATSLQFGAVLPILIRGKDPEGVHGYRGVVWFQPQNLIWPQWNIYAAGSVGHWWVHGAQSNRILNTYALAPVIRYYFVKSLVVSPYIEASIGASYLTRTRFGNDHNLGMHFAFQDEIGIGAVFGKEQRFYTSLSALHYSNGSLASMNAGITIPLILNLGYQFA